MIGVPLTTAQAQELFLADWDAKAALRLEMQQMLRERLSEWGRTRGFKFHMAVLSLAKGAYDDLLRDLARGRLTLAEADEIVDQFVAYQVTTPTLAAWYKEKFRTVDPKQQNSGV